MIMLGNVTSLNFFFHHGTHITHGSKIRRKREEEHISLEKNQPSNCQQVIILS